MSGILGRHGWIGASLFWVSCGGSLESASQGTASDQDTKAADGRSASVYVPPAQSAAKEAPAAPRLEPAEDALSLLETRRYVLSPRSRQLVLAELTGLENLFTSTPRLSPDRHQLVRRLAEGYAELHAGARRENGQSQVVSDALQKEIKYYGLLRNEYPQYPRLDEVLFFAAIACAHQRDLREARKSLFELIQKVPSSPYVPFAYYAFGELFRIESTGDPSKLELAEMAYAETGKFPPPANKIYCLAQARRGVVAAAARKRAAAVQALRSALACLDQYEDQLGAQAAREQASTVLARLDAGSPSE
jgi:tetratricopeptide (TPR) repeat protein